MMGATSVSGSSAPLMVLYRVVDSRTVSQMFSLGGEAMHMSLTYCGTLPGKGLSGGIQYRRLSINNANSVMSILTPEPSHRPKILVLTSSKPPSVVPFSNVTSSPSNGFDGSKGSTTGEYDAIRGRCVIFFGRRRKLRRLKIFLKLGWLVTGLVKGRC